MEYDLGLSRASRTTPPRIKCPPNAYCCCYYSLIVFCVSLVTCVVLFFAMVLNSWIMEEHPIDKPIWTRVDDSNISVTTPMLERLQDAIRVKSVSTGYRQYNVGALERFQEHLENSFPKIHKPRGFIVFEKVESFSLLYTIQGADATLDPYVLCAHLDVVPAEERDSNQKRVWSEPPFSGKLKNNEIWGRGALDGKSSLMAIMEALEFMLPRQPTRSFYLAFSHDEEVNGDGAIYMARLLQQRSVRPLFVIDEGSQILKGFLPGTDKQVGVIAVTEKGSLDLKVTTKAKGGSSSVPTPGLSAIGRLSQAIWYIEYNQFPSHLRTAVTRQMLEYLSPHMDFGTRLVMSNLWLLWPVVSLYMSYFPTSNAQIRTTAAVTQIYGGKKLNVLPQEAYAYVNLRIIPGESPASVLEAVKSAVGDDEVEYEEYGRTSVSPTESYFSEQTFGYQLLKSNIHNFFPDTLVIPGLTLRGTDARHYHAICKQVYRFVPLIRDSSKEPMMQGNNERIKVTDYERMINFYYILMKGADSSHLPYYPEK